MAGAGFLLAAQHFHHLAIGLFIAVLGGMAFVIASACVFNNYLDQSIDSKMKRTKKRALVTHTISGPAALVYGSALGSLGFIILGIFTNARVVWLNLAAIISYVVIYGWAKRNSVHGTLVGTVPGAIPPVAGYAALAPLDRGALLLFLILVFWQMPHFYSIALYRFKDYQAAGLPVMPVRHGIKATRAQIIAYVPLLAAACILLSAFGYTGWIFLIASLVLCATWLMRGLKRFALADAKWGRLMFLNSLIVLVGLSVLIPLGAVLP